MKRPFKIPSKLINSVAFLAAAFLVNHSVLNAQSFRVFAVSDLVQVFEDGYKLPVTYDTIKIFGIRGEILSGQFGIRAKKGLTDVSIEVSALKNQVTGNILPANVAEWNFVGSIPLEKNAPNQPLAVLVRSAPARYPDYLMVQKKLDITEKTIQAVWLTISIPADASAGNYTGKVTVKCAQGDLSLPVFLTVYPLTLPFERHLKVVEWYSTDKFSALHGIKEEYSDEWFAMLKIYAENMVAHRQNIFQVPMDAIEIRRSKTNELEFDFTRFDQIARVFWNTGKMDYMETGELTRFGIKGWSDTEILLSDFSVTDSGNGEKITMPGEKVIPYLLPAFESHLRQKGWLHKTHFGIKDEPSLHNALAWRDVSSYIHTYAPDLIRMDAIETTYVLNDIEIAVPKLDALASWYKSYKEWEQKGNELWFYTVGIYQGSLLPNKTIDMPVMDSRILHWLNYKYDATGYLHWGWNQWTDNPYVDPDIHIGDGWHVYPVKGGVLNSLRWEQMRNGIQDYEYFWMLENKIKALKDSLGSRFAWIDPKQRGKEIASNVVMDFAEHTDDPQVLYNAKMQIIRELLDFDESPRIYVQTNPLVNSTLTNHSSVEVFGWTEPGTKIIINGVEIPVSKQGLFLEQFGGDFIDPTKIHLGHIIRIQASNAKGSKEIVRDFIIK
jgi:hypothetical protein